MKKTDEGSITKPMTTKDVAKRIGSCGRVARAIIKREIPYFLVGNKLRVEAADVENWIRFGKQSASQNENSATESPKDQASEITDENEE
jgi:excisionase family DNA binding protein